MWPHRKASSILARGYPRVTRVHDADMDAPATNHAFHGGLFLGLCNRVGDISKPSRERVSCHDGGTEHGSKQSRENRHLTGNIFLARYRALDLASGHLEKPRA